MKTIVLDLSTESIDNAIKEVKAYKDYIHKGLSKLLLLLGEEGMQIASAGYNSAEYDGTNDVEVVYETRGDNTVYLVAVGRAVLFIEFGTGIRYANIHPEAMELGMNRGEYGKGLGGSSNGWVYVGEKGTNGKAVNTKDDSGKTVSVVRTYGNPASMTMYTTRQKLKDRIYTLAKECF